MIDFAKILGSDSSERFCFFKLQDCQASNLFGKLGNARSRVVHQPHRLSQVGK